MDKNEPNEDNDKNLELDQEEQEILQKFSEEASNTEKSSRKNESKKDNVRIDL